MEKCSYFVGNVLVQVKYVFLSNYLLILSLLKPTGVRVFWNKKNSVQNPNRGNLLNNNIDNKVI